MSSTKEKTLSHLEEIMKLGDGQVTTDAIAAWRKQNPDTRLDLCDADLSNVELIKADLSGARLHSADLSGAILQQADLSGAELSMAKMEGANLGVANLEGANLSMANLKGVNLFSANLRQAAFMGANMEGVQNTTIHHFARCSGLREVYNPPLAIIGALLMAHPRSS